MAEVNNSGQLTYRWLSGIMVSVFGVILTVISGWTLSAVLDLKDIEAKHGYEITDLQKDEARHDGQIEALQQRQVPQVSVKPEINIPPSTVADAVSRRQDILEKELQDERKVTGQLVRLEVQLEALMSHQVPIATPKPTPQQEGWWKRPKPGPLPPGTNHAYGAATAGGVTVEDIGAGAVGTVRGGLP